MKKCLISVQCAILLALASGCVIHHHPRGIVHHRPHPAPVIRHFPAPPPVVVVETPRPRPVVVNIPKPHPHPMPPPQVIAVKGRQEPWVHVTINPREREVIREYVVYRKAKPDHDHKDKHGKPEKGLPKGLAKKIDRGHDLPPGWQKRCVRGQIMPVEIYNRCEPLPREVVVKLPAPPPGTIIVTIEGKAVRLLQATREILDVFDVI